MATTPQGSDGGGGGGVARYPLPQSLGYYQTDYGGFHYIQAPRASICGHLTSGDKLRVTYLRRDIDSTMGPVNMLP